MDDKPTELTREDVDRFVESLHLVLNFDIGYVLKNFTRSFCGAIW